MPVSSPLLQRLKVVAQVSPLPPLEREALGFPHDPLPVRGMGALRGGSRPAETEPEEESAEDIGRHLFGLRPKKKEP